jgi:hypothetical protein
MYKFEDIHLTSGEKRSLFSFHFQKRKRKERIKHFNTLYYDFEFLSRNLMDETDANNNRIHDGTYSISDRYCRYKIWRKKQRLNTLPNWIAIAISIISLVISAIPLLS